MGIESHPVASYVRTGVGETEDSIEGLGRTTCVLMRFVLMPATRPRFLRFVVQDAERVALRTGTPLDFERRFGSIRSLI